MQQESTRLDLRVDFPRDRSVISSRKDWGCTGNTSRLPAKPPPLVQLRPLPSPPAPVPAHPGSDNSFSFQEAPRCTELTAGLLSGCRLSSRLLLLKFPAGRNSQQRP